MEVQHLGRGLQVESGETEKRRHVDVRAVAEKTMSQTPNHLLNRSQEENSLSRELENSTREDNHSKE